MVPNNRKLTCPDKYVLKRIVLRHNEEVIILSNMDGVVYPPYPKGIIRMTFGLISLDLEVLYTQISKTYANNAVP